MDKILFWFRNDLRLHDNEALLRASQLGKVLPVYVIDPRLLENTQIGIPKMSAMRLQFLLECLQDLKKSLEKIGSDLLVLVGKPEELIPALAKKQEVKMLITSKEVTQEETSLEYEISQQLKPSNIDMEMVWGATLFHVRDLPFQVKFLPDVFTDFRKKIEKQSSVRPQVPSIQSLELIEGIEIPAIPTLRDFGLEEINELRFRGGESEAKKRLDYYFWQKSLLKTYKETRNGMLGDDYSSKFSAYISLGCLSPRYIYEQVKKYEREVISNSSTYWLVFELLWRDYFHFVALKFGIRLFKRSGIRHVMNLQWKQDKGRFEKWCHGKTGIPLIDACMRELNATGFMSNRGRQLVASFLTKDLKIEWWWGATYFESKLLDYDVCSNWGNWNYVAGIGNDPRENRYFNIARQGKMYDADGEFVKHWCPELQDIPSDLIHTPWKWPEHPEVYPVPMIRLRDA